MEKGRLYKLKIKNGIDREPDYTLIKLVDRYLLIWERGRTETVAWLYYKNDKVEELISTGYWVVEEQPVEENLTFR